MAIGRRIGRALLVVLIGLGVLLWLAALLLFSQVAENSDDFARYPNWIVLINSIGVAVLLALIGARLVRLLRDYRRFVPGSRLQARMVSLVVVLGVTPLVVLYIFSVQFVNRGIDDWFNVDVEAGLGNALALGQTALELQRREDLAKLQQIAGRLRAGDPAALITNLSDLRQESGAEELTLFSANNQIIATISDDPPGTALTLPSVPSFPADEVLIQLRQGLPYVSLDLEPNGGYEIVAVVPLTYPDRPGESEYLRAIFPVDERISELANAVQISYNQFAELGFLSTALKYSFTLTLSLVLLVAILASVYGAFFSAQRLIVPIQQLMQGTRAVARGDFDTRLPITARDEIGFLVNSFNDMTQRLASARQETRESEEQLESERRKLEVILARLTTGVISLESDLRIRTANRAAGAILDIELETHVGESLVNLAEQNPLLKQVLAVCTAHLQRGESEWREQISLRGKLGGRELMCACSELPLQEGDARGHVIVFDEITALMQAQRDAAWGEVARRLAHEIKNPLTPIQLSAERLRRRFLGGDVADLDLLDRATHTIIQQVDAMKEMVNAFSQYARVPKIDLATTDLNGLIVEVTELYRHQEQPVRIDIDASPDLPPIQLDAGRMRQVVHNLMRNAIEAMEGVPNARIRIETHLRSTPNGDQAEISLTDNGPGFADEIMDQAFYPYVTSKPKGTGLGLAIVKKLVEEHGGQIRAGNAKRGGAEISILIPVTHAEEDSKLNQRADKGRESA
jgi:nitrogen fixation/metabolism regulation signal transduction histidine kinase